MMDAPVCREKTQLLRLTAEELKGAHRLRATHLAEKEGGLVVAEGEEEIAAVGYGVTGIDCLNGELFLLLGTGECENYSSGTVYPISGFRLLSYPMTDGSENTYAVTERNIYRISEGGVSLVAAGKGGECAAVFCERLFTASGCRVYYSDALYPEDWQERRYGAGYVDLSHAAGKICAMLPYKERLYLFRSHGITALRVLGDEINFKASYLAMRQGTLIQGSVAPCGEEIGYFTEHGFYLFNGAGSRRAAAFSSGEVDFGEPVKAVSCRGRYYALIRRPSGGRAVYCYDPDGRAGHFIENGAEDIAAEDGVWFLRGGKLFRLTERGFCQGVIPAFTAENVAFTAGGERLYTAVAAEGEGSFTVTLTSARGARTLSVTAGVPARLRQPLRGRALRVRVIPATESARFDALHLVWKEEESNAD